MLLCAINSIPLYAMLYPLHRTVFGGGEFKMRDADRIRIYGQEKYGLPARQRKEQRFSIRVGDVVRELKLTGRTPAVCRALKTGAFLASNDLNIVDPSSPKPWQGTTI